MNTLVQLLKKLFYDVLGDNGKLSYIVSDEKNKKKKK